MSCGPAGEGQQRSVAPGWQNMLADEGFRLFFPLAAIYAALWPLLWVLILGLDLPLATTMPASLWHAHEMLVGAFGAALIGFLTTAAPEWTDSEPMRGRPLWGFAAIWGIGRVVGVLGWDGFGLVGAIADLGWMCGLLLYLARLSWAKQSERLLAFMFWLLVLGALLGWTRWAFLVGDIEMAQTAIRLFGIAFLGVLGLALARITVPITNLVLDPSERTSPFRPHPGRLHLAPGLILVVVAGEVSGLSPTVTAFLYIAAGAAFMDRLAEAFIGPEVLRGEILLLAGASTLAGLGLLMIGAGRLDAPWSEIGGLHIAFMGGLGLGVIAVLSIAGLLHTGQSLGVPIVARAGAVCVVVSVVLRALPEFYDVPSFALVSGHHLTSVMWAAGFLAWVWAYLPAILDRSTIS